MEIKIASANEFERLLNGLCDETVTACIHFRLFSDLKEARRHNATVFNQAWTFWSLTFQAHLDTTLFRLCKVYDQNTSSLNLRNLLDTIEANIGIFEVENFKIRLKDNPYVESLAMDAKRPNSAVLMTDRETVSDCNPLVKALVFWRNNFYAHRSAKHVAAEKNLTDY